MPKLTPENTDKLRILKKQIETDLGEISKGLCTASKAMDDSITSAWQVGNALIQAKELTGHGDFRLWAETITGLGESSVSRYMRLAKMFTLTNLPANKKAAYRLMEIVPSSGKADQTGNGTTTAPPDGFMQIAGKWRSWMADVEEKHIDYNPEEVKRHFQPMYQWLKELYGE